MSDINIDPDKAKSFLKGFNPKLSAEREEEEKKKARAEAMRKQYSANG